MRTILARRRNPEAFVELLRRVVARVETLTTREALDGMEREKAPCGAVIGPDRLHLDPQVVARGVVA